MKELYTSGKSLIAIGILLLVSACSQNLTYQEAMSKNERKINDIGKLNDARFLVDAKSFNTLETKLAEAAITSGYASVVVDMARKHQRDLEQMEEDIVSLARKEKVVVPAGMSEQHQMQLFEVTQRSKQDFDSYYVNSLKRINEENKERYMQMATDAADADIRAFAARKLDVLNNHSTELQQIETKLMNTY